MKSLVFEEVLEQVGSKGFHQKWLVWGFISPLNFFLPLLFLSQLFYTTTPPHHCAPPPLVPSPPPHTSQQQTESLNSTSIKDYSQNSELEQLILTSLSHFGNTTLEIWKNVAIPRSENGGELEECSQFNVTWLDILQYNNSLAANETTLEDLYNVTSCQHGYHYDQEEGESTLPSTLDWVCDSKLLSSTWLTVGVAGRIVGCFVFLSLADIIGRRYVVILSSLVFCVFGIMRVYVTSLWAVMMTQFLCSLPFPTLLEVGIIIVMEQVSPDWRALTNGASFVIWTVGMSTLPLFAMLLPDWRDLCLTTTVLYAVFSLSFWFVPESPSWLLSRGRQEETVELLKSIAKRNNVPVPPDLQEQVARIEGEDSPKYGPLQLFGTPRVRNRTILLTICFTCNILVYYGPTYNLENMAGNQYLNFFIMSVTEAPGNLFGWWLMDVVGRRWSQIGGFVLSSILLVIAIPLIDQPWWSITLVATLSKFFISISFLAIYIQTAEIFPTSLRSTGTGFCSIVGALFSIALPYIALMSDLWKGLPYLVMVVIGTIGSVAAFLIPETLGVMLPQTIEDAEQFLPNEPLLSYKGKRIGSWCGTNAQENETNVIKGGDSEQQITRRNASSDKDDENDTRL